MRSILFFGVLAMISLTSCNDGDKKAEATSGTDDKAAIRTVMIQYDKVFREADWDGLLDIIHPAVFKDLPRTQLKKQLEESFETKDYRMRFTGVTIDSIHPVMNHDNDRYSLVDVTVSAGMDMTATPSPSVCDAMKSDPNFVSCSVDSNKIKFSLRDRCYAIYKGDKKKWFILSKDEETEDIVHKIVPKEVRDKLGY
jgi:hypothetical protein